VGPPQCAGTRCADALAAVRAHRSGRGSRQLYRLTTPERVVEVDPRDVSAMLRTGWFIGM